MKTRLIILGFAAGLGATNAVLPAQAADLRGAAVQQARPIPGPPDACADPVVLRDIADRFAWAESHTWHRGFVVARLERPRAQIGDIPTISMIPHKKCTAEATMTNGSRTSVYYQIDSGMGFASIGKGLDFCFLGLDPWRVHDADCRSVR